MNSIPRMTAEESVAAGLRAAVDISNMDLSSAVKTPAVTLRPRGKKGKFSIYVGGERFKSTRTNDLNLAEAKAKVVETKLIAEQIGFVNQRATPLATICGWVLDSLEVSKPQVNASPAERNAYNKFMWRQCEIKRLMPVIKGKTLSDVNSEWALHAAKYLTSEGYADNTVRETLSAFKTCLRAFCAAARLPIETHFKLPPKPPGRMQLLTHEEIERLIGIGLHGWVWDKTKGDWALVEIRDPSSGAVSWSRRLQSQRERAMLLPAFRFFMLALVSIGRHGAVIDLRWVSTEEAGHVDLDNGMIWRSGKARAETSKDAGGVPIGPDVVRFLRQWRDADLDAGIHHCIHQMRPKSYGHPYARAQHFWRRLMIAADIPVDITPHAVKSVMLSWLCAQGVPVAAAAAAAGNDTETVERYYKAVRSDHDVAPAVAAINAAFSSGLTVPTVAINSEGRSGYGLSYVPRSAETLSETQRRALNIPVDPRKRKPIQLLPTKGEAEVAAIEVAATRLLPPPPPLLPPPN